MLRTNHVSFFYMFSADVYFIFWETSYLSENKFLQESHIKHTFVPKELFFCFVSIHYLGMQRATDHSNRNAHSGI